jgi:SAM-dependent methyltransferase
MTSRQRLTEGERQMTSASEWSGPVGDAWASEWRRTDRSFAGLTPYLDAAILAAAGPAPRVIVDIGCGAGATSMATAAAFPDAQVTGIDLSPDLIATATQRAEGRSNLAFVAGAVEERLASLAPIDLFVSRHGVMFFADPVAGLSALRQAAAPGATLVFSCFRAAALNPWASEIAIAIQGTPPAPPEGYAPGPFAFADPAFVSGVLEDSGWRVLRNEAVDYTYRAGEGALPIVDALAFFERIGPAAPVLRAASPDDRAAMLDRIATMLATHRSGDAVDFPAAAWLWSARAES